MKTQIKRTVSVVMAILMLVALAPISDLGVTAQAAETGTFKYEVSNGEATIVRFYYGEYDEDEDDYDDDESYDYKYYSHEYGGDLVIPDKLGGYPVTHIGYEAFKYGCDDLTSITIPDSVTSIGGYAFYYCYSLKSITIPDSVTSIDDSAFGNCYSLTSIKIGSGVTSIGDSAFDGCSDLESIKVSSNNKKYSSANGVLFNKNKTTIIRYPEGKSATSYTIPDSVTSIDDGAFEDCRFKSITIPDSVTSIASNAFQECGLKSLKIGSGVKSIGWRAFYDCTGLTKITISDNVTEISDEAFSGTGYYKNSSNWKNGVLYIGNHLIKADKESIKGSYKIKSGTKCIADWAFSDCTGLTSVTIPDSVTSIGGRAFDDCSSLTSVKIGSGVKSIGVCAFFCCGLTSITIPDSVTSIGDSAFYGCNNLKSITIPDSVTSIGRSAFEDCSSLKSITIPDSVTSIGSYAFEDCSSLTSIKVSSNNKKYSSANGVLFNKNKTTVIKYPVQKSATSYTIPSSVTSIDYEAFSGCNNLKSITIPDSVTSIGGYAFSSCTGLKSITIPDSVTSIGSSAFYKTGYYNNSSNWKNGVLYIGNHLIEAKESIKGSYKIKSGTKCIADSAFYDCTDLKSITIPDSVTSIGYGTFSGCNNLKSITIPDSVTSIGDYSFEYCSSLKSITIPNSVTSIGEDAFSGTAYYNNSSNWKNGVLYIGNHLIKAKNSIKGSYKIKSGTKCIADFAFWYCTDLKSITIPDSVTSIGYGTFSGCNNLKSITIPGSVTNIGDSAFYECTGLTSITIPGSVKIIGKKAFGYAYDKAKDDDAPISGFTIKGHKGSTADTYAKENGFKFISHKNNYTTKVTTKATTSKNGKITYTCDCGYKFKKSIAKIASVKLSHTSYTYNGKAKKPTVTVKDSKGNKLKSGTDYTVKYSSGRKDVGKYTVTVTFKGKYSGTKKLTFKIVPKSTSISKLTSGTKKFTVNVKKQSTQTTGYQIQYSKNSNMKNASTKTFANTSKTSRTITGLKSSTKYYVQVRTYKNVKIDGKTYKYYSSWSSIKSVKTK